MSTNKFSLAQNDEVTFAQAGIDPRGMITRTDKRGKILFASKAFRVMSVFDKEELMGMSHNIVRHPLMPKSVFKEMWSTIKKGRAWRGPVVNRRKDGKYYWVDIEISPIDKDGNIISDKSKIEGYVAIRKELSKLDKEKAYKKYMQLKEAEYKDMVSKKM